MYKQNTNLIQLQNKCFAHLFTRIRDKNVNPAEFKHYADRLMRVLAEEGLAYLPNEPVGIETPTNCTLTGTKIPSSICAVSIIRAGDALLSAILKCDHNIAVGKILIQRDEDSIDKTPVLLYSKLPPQISDMHVILVDPMLATGGSATMAIKALIEAGVNEERILFLNVIACPEGIERVFQEYPSIKIVTAQIDEGLNSKKFITPGLGDYGDRYFNTIA